MSTITKLSQDITQYYKNITSLIGAIAIIQRDTIMNSTKYAREIQKKNSRDEQRDLKGWGSGRSTADPCRNRCATLITRKSTTVQTLRSENTGLGESELPNEWCGECQVTYIDKHMCIDKFKSKACIENRVMSTDIQEQTMRQQEKQM